MSTPTRGMSLALACAASLIAVAGAGGYWAGSRAPAVPADASGVSNASPSAAGQGAATTLPGSAGSAPPMQTPAARKILYYRNPMGLPDVSTTPKKDSMGMDYIPVYEAEEQGGSAPGAAGEVRVSTEKVQKLGVRTEHASLMTLSRAVRAPGRVEPDERRMFMITPKFEGWVERLHVNATGQAVTKGQALFEVYAPEMVSAQREYAIAVQGQQAMRQAGVEAQAGMKQLAESSLARLSNWDLPPEQIEALVKTGEVRRTVTFRSPVSGIVTEKKAVQGMRFMPGEALYQVTDLSSVWVMAEVPEQDISLVRVGARATVTLAAYPAQPLQGRITTVYPTLKPETRSVPVRVELPNPKQMLKPAMFAQVEIESGASARVLAVPDSAVIDTGTRRLVLVQRAEGRFEPREVKLGARSDSHVQVLEGVKEGERVVVAANFLIDAESNLKAAVSGLAPAPVGAATTSGAATAGAAASPAPGAVPGALSGPVGSPKPTVGHQARGTVDSLDAKAGLLTLAHEPVASLKWPAMTMEFKAAGPALFKGLKPGMRLAFEFVERAPGEWVVTSITPEAARPTAAGQGSRPAASAPAAHTGH